MGAEGCRGSREHECKIANESLTADQDKRPRLVRCIGLGDVVFASRSRAKQAMEISEYGKHGKPRNRLPTLPTLFGNPFGISTFPRARRLDSCLFIPLNSKSWPTQGACNGCLRSTALRLSRYTHGIAPRIDFAREGDVENLRLIYSAENSSAAENIVIPAHIGPGVGRLE